MPTNTSPAFYTHSSLIVSNFSTIDHLHVEDDGSITAIALSRVKFFNPDGSLNEHLSALNPPPIGPNLGVVMVDFKAMPDGSVIAGGFYYLSQEATGYLLFRVTPNGYIDASFGNGKGWAGGPAIDSSYFEHMDVGRDGKIVVTGSAVDDNRTVHLTVSRFAADGKVDTTFGKDGAVVLPGRAFGNGVFVQSDGKILINSTHDVGQFSVHPAVYRLNVDGTLGTSFGTSGMAAIEYDGAPYLDYSSWASAMGIQPDGKIVIAGTSEDQDTYTGTSKFAVTRLNADGTLDKTFGNGGKVEYFVSAEPGAWIPGGSVSAKDTVASLVIRQDGSIVIGGSVYRDHNGAEDSQFALLALNADGSPETSFGNQGTAIADFGSPNSYPKSLTETPDGKLILAGSIWSGINGTSGQTVLASLNADGSPNTNFGTVSGASQNVAIYTAGHLAVALNPGLSIRDAELDAHKSYEGAYLQLARHGGANAGDKFLATGSLNIANGKASVGGIEIGTVTSVNGSLRIDFNANATTSLVNMTLQSIGYRNTTDLVANKDIVIDWTFNDGNQGTGGALQAQASTQVKLLATQIPGWIDGSLTALAASADPSAHLNTDHSLAVNFVAASNAKPFSTTDKAALNGLLAKVANVADLNFSASSASETSTLSIVSSSELATGATAYAPLSGAGATISVGLPGSGVAGVTPELQQHLLQVLGVQSEASSALSDVQIATLQYLYGPSKTVRVGDDTYVLSDAKANFLWDGGGKDTISAAGIASDLTLHLEAGHWDYIGSKGSDITGAGQITINYGSIFENAIGGNGNDSITGTSGANKLQGGAGNDRLEGLGGGDFLDGGSGVDTAVYAGKRADYTITRSGSTVTIQDANGKDTLTAIERVHFTDADVALDIDGTAGQLFRLYQAIFDRKPDLAGLGWWLDAMDKGLTLGKAAELFAQAPEYKAMYGANPDNAGLITKLYEHALHREPEKDGLSWWKDILDNHKASLGEVLVGFSESPENYAQVIGSMQNGIAYIPFHG